MKVYKIYAGLGGGFGGAEFQGTYEFNTPEEADKAAYDMAWEIYESYGGNHGLSDWDAVYEDCLESEWIDPASMTESEIEQVVNDAYIETVEGWLEYYAKETDSDEDPEDDEYDGYWDDEEDDEDDDDDSDCYCE